MTKLRTDWSGVFPAVVTPFDSRGDIDLKATRSLIDLLISEGVDGILIAGSTGEWYSLSDEELGTLYRVSVEQVNGRIPVVVGTTAIGTREAVARTRMAKDSGADGCMLLPPPYCLASHREVLAHFEAVAKVGLPIMVYNNPLRTGVSINADLGRQLLAFDSVVAYKESSRDLYQTSETIYALSGEIAVFMGLEPYGLTGINRGCVGLVSSMGNICALELVKYYRSALAGDMDACREMQRTIDTLYHVMAASGVPLIPFVKSVMQLLERPGGHSRLPHVAPDDAMRMRIQIGLEKVRFLNR